MVERMSKPDPAILTQFQMVGEGLFQAGLNNSHSGNLSIRKGDRLVITRTGAMLGRLTPLDLIETGISYDDDQTRLASTEIGVHRAIYRATEAQAIVHAHPVMAVSFSLCLDELVPLDAEGQYYLPKVPVLRCAETIGSREVEEKLPNLLAACPVAVVGGHGSFAAAKTLEEAYKLTASLEHSCKINYYTRSLR